jgi:hypothetical protein
MAKLSEIETKLKKWVNISQTNLIKINDKKGTKERI